MQRITLAALGLVAALTLAVVGIGVASAQSGTTEADTTYDRFINRVAQILGKQPAQIRSAMTQASTEQIDQAVKDGDLSQEQADDIKARIAETGRPFPMFGGRHHGGKFGRHGGVAGEVTKVSGTTVTVETPDGNKTVKLTEDTEIRNEGEEAQASAIKVGSFVHVRGDADSNGVVTADAVMIGGLSGPGFGGRHHGHHEFSGVLPGDNDSNEDNDDSPEGAPTEESSNSQ